LAYCYRERPARSLDSALGSKFDYFATVAQNANFYPTSHQARIGSWYLPNSAVLNGDGANGWKEVSDELYMITMQALGCMGYESKLCATSPYKYRAERFQVFQTLERSGVIDMAGVPLNNSRLLSIQQVWNANFSTVASTSNGILIASPTLIDLFLYHSILVRVYLSGATVEV
jgi:hypothetical protein